MKSCLSCFYIASDLHFTISPSDVFTLYIAFTLKKPVSDVFTLHLTRILENTYFYIFAMRVAPFLLNSFLADFLHCVRLAPCRNPSTAIFAMHVAGTLHNSYISFLLDSFSRSFFHS